MLFRSISNKPCWQLWFGTKIWEPLLRAILPYLVAKKPQAELILTVRDMQREKPAERLGHYGCDLGDVQRHFRKAAYWDLRRMNTGKEHEGQPSLVRDN